MAPLSNTNSYFLAPATTSLPQQLSLLHQQPPSCTSSYQFCTSSYQPCTDNYLPTPATNSTPTTTRSEPATTFRHQQTPATTSPERATTFLHQQIPTTTSPEPATTFLHQQKPVLNQKPSSCNSRNQSCTSNHLSNEYQSCTSYPDLLQQLGPTPTLAAAIVCCTLFRFTIRHNKVWSFEATPLFCHSCLVCCQSLIFQKFAGTGIFFWPLQPSKSECNSVTGVQTHLFWICSLTP